VNGVEKRTDLYAYYMQEPGFESGHFTIKLCEL